MQSTDLAPLFTTTTDTAPPVGLRQGVVKTWNPATGANTVDVAGTLLTDLPTIGSSAEVARIAPGDVVVLLTFQGSWFVLGRVTRPGTAGAATATQIQTVSATITASCSTTSASFADPNTSGTPGPAVNANIGPSGRALVTVGAAVGYQGNAAFAVSGASTRAPSSTEALLSGGAVGSGPTIGASRRVLVEGLTPGVNTFTAKYASSTGGVVVFADRNITVEPL